MDTWEQALVGRHTRLAANLDGRRAQHVGTSAGRDGAAWKETGRDLAPAEILDIVEAQRLKLRMEGVAVEMIAKLFAGRGHPRAQRLMHGAPAGFGHRIRWVDIIEHDVRAARQCGCGPR